MPRAKDNRPGARRRGYDKAHEKWRQRVLARDRRCRMCNALGSPSDHADHIAPVRQGGARFDPANGQRLCQTCHAGPKQSYERTGVMRGCDPSGVPLDAGHHWRRE